MVDGHQVDAAVVDDEGFPILGWWRGGWQCCLASVELGVSTSRLRLDLGRKGCSGMGAGVLVQGISVIRYLSPTNVQMHRPLTPSRQYLTCISTFVSKPYSVFHCRYIITKYCNSWYQ